MGYAEKRGPYFRGRFKIADGKYGTVSDAEGRTIKFATKREAKQAADAVEAKIREKGWRDPALGLETFGEYASRWYAEQELASTTMQNYRRAIEEHLLPEFGERPLKSIHHRDVAAWEKKEKEAGYQASSIRTWRARLHLVLADAVEEGLIDANPASRRRGRGKRAGRVSHRGPEKVFTSPLGILLVSERLAVLSGRDDEFVAGVLKGYTGKRWGELVGLETRYARRESRAIRVEWQLAELDSGVLERCPPKDDSYRTIDVPLWLSDLVGDHILRTNPQPCPCHGFTYVFSSFGTVRRWGRGGGPTVKDVARLAEVSAGTVSNVLNRPEAVGEKTRLRVVRAIAELDYTRGRTPEETAAHWRRKGFASRLFHPAVTGMYEQVGTRPAAAVPLVADPWPGVLVQGRGAAARATTCWVPIAPGLTPHGLRHSHRTIMEELGTPKVLMDERMGHIDGSVSARYAHVTDDMRHRLMTGLTRVWEASLDARLAMSPRSPVRVLDTLLRARAAEIFSQNSPG